MSTFDEAAVRTPRVFASIADFAAIAGSEIGTSGWLEITQDRVDEFARATGDFQWIHVDPERAATGPFGGTIAQGYLTFSLVAWFAVQIYDVRGVEFGVNYGSDRLRFPAPVPVGSRVRATATLLSATAVALGTRFDIEFVVECDAADKPACIAQVSHVLA